MPGSMEAPEGRFLHIAAGIGRFCGVREDHSVTCWGCTDFDVESCVPQEGAFDEVVAGDGVCARRRGSAEVVCWGVAEAAEWTDALTAAGVHGLSMGFRSVCALDADDEIVCVGEIIQSGQRPPRGRFSRVSVAGTHACAVDPDGRGGLLGLRRIADPVAV